MIAVPDRMLWAWERPEDLRFADPAKVGVAFLSQTITLEGDDVRLRSRRQPLEVAKDAFLMAVTRIETAKERDKRAALSDEQIAKVVRLILRTEAMKGVRAVQVDFDAVVSERPFYRRLLSELRQGLTAGTPLSITSLASWCMGDRWFGDLPVDEVVPMAFDMGTDEQVVRSYITGGSDWKEPKCRKSYGLMIGDKLLDAVDSSRRIYFFKAAAWSRSDLEKLNP